MPSFAKEHDEANPVSGDRAARRTLILAALSCRGSIDAAAGQAQAESLRERILDWIELLKLEQELEPNEQRVLHARLGTLEPRDIIDATWSVEGLAILAWGLNRFDLPRHDEKVDPFTVTDSLLFLSDDAAELIRSPSLRSVSDLRAYREVAYAVHCRLRDFARHRQKKDFAAWVDKTWIDLLKIDAARLIVGGDLGIDDREISDVEQERIQTCEWVTFRRHRAIIWLLGDHPVYSQTPVDT